MESGLLFLPPPLDEEALRINAVLEPVKHRLVTLHKEIEILCIYIDTCTILNNRTRCQGTTFENI